MTERRRAARREPIEVEVVDGRVFTSVPLPWMAANDLGDEIIRQNAESVNNSVRLYMDGNIPQLEAALGVKIKNWKAVLDLAFPNDVETLNTNPLSPDENAELVLAALEVNHLEHLRPLVDPNSPPPTENGGNEPSLAGILTTIGPKTESTQDSGSEVSVAEMSSTSQEESSSES